MIMGMTTRTITATATTTSTEPALSLQPRFPGVGAGQR